MMQRSWSYCCVGSAGASADGIAYNEWPVWHQTDAWKFFFHLVFQATAATIISGAMAETKVLAALLKAIARLLGNKGNLRLDFMQRGALTLAQEAKTSSSAELREAIKSLNSTYPGQMVAATESNYESNLLMKISC